ncbi:response regulator transcription factor [Novosphingobium sp. PASSN1]|uniref:response regulator n=1 Tax=Novosphingobium sp. PASSN1 TaxID=2015561 RepID=UPI000BD76E39|nr:response regulator transcription factor [Novosphingobium sp. PASSN1]OYU34521.1 MAG: DNA-binding response regulator [Novosphingobium sp. PASSN1]
MAALACDDHPLVRSALALVLEDIVSGPVLTAQDYAGAWAHAEARDDIEIAVVDLHMPGIGGLEGLAGLRERAPYTRIVVLTGSDSDDDLLAVLALGVEGFVPKSVEPGVVEAAIRLVMAGGRYLPARVAELAAQSPAAAPASAPRAATAPPIEAPLGRLSSRQRDVLDQMARGRANKEIAQLLGLSPATVKTHVAHIIAVVGASNRTEAATRARELGLV